MKAIPAITIRYAHDTDGPAIVRLAALDSKPLPRSPVQLAEVEGELWAARSLQDGATIADPFRATAAVRGLLAVRAAQLSTAPATLTALTGSARGLLAG